MYTRLFVVIIMALSTLGTTTLVATPAANASSATFANQVEAAIHKYTNAQRRAHGRRAVVRSSCVDRYAEGWARHLRQHWPVLPPQLADDRAWAATSPTQSENIAKYSARRLSGQVGKEDRRDVDELPEPPRQSALQQGPHHGCRRGEVQQWSLVRRAELRVLTL